MPVTAIAGPHCRRHLAACDLRRVPRIETDVLVVGSGAAGLTSALHAAAAGARVLVLAKSPPEESNSHYAQGGVAAVLDALDDLDQHVADTLAAGAGHCDAAAVRSILADGPTAVEDLAHRGCVFNLGHDGQPHLTREGGHRQRRILHANGDATGREIVRALLAAARAEPRITLLPRGFAIDLLDDGGRIRGMLYRQGGELRAALAAATILATGGCGQVYRETTNPEVATGDGLAMAYRAGATLADVEFVQFHPTTLYIAGAARLLITEAVRGEGAILKNARGEAFMERYHPLGDLAPRDVVSRSIIAEIRASRCPHVWLDATHLDAAFLQERFPGVGRTCRGFGIDFSRDWIPVHPSAHYHCGGVRTDTAGATRLPGLWACGEVACTGLHGANRLASNSLLECLVVGARAGRAAAGAAPVTGVPTGCMMADERITPAELDVADMVDSLRALMWRQVGLERDGASLAHAGRSLRFWLDHQAAGRFTERTAWTMQNLLTVGALIAAAAEGRTANCGTHFRADASEGGADLLLELRRPIDA